MKERPILFSGPMVRAILAGTKTVTRRIVDLDMKPGASFAHVGGCTFDLRTPHHVDAALKLCRYGLPGDRLWVRETLCERGQWRYAADDAPVTLSAESPHVPAMISWAHHKEGSACVSSHMPRWASRITLEIVSVRCERLQGITDDDIRAEGVTREAAAELMGLESIHDIPEGIGLSHLWERGWDAINGKRAAWATNPWVWRIEFRRLP